MANLSQAGMTTRQKATAGVFVLILIVIAWQVIGLFRGHKTTTPPPTMVVNKTTTTTSTVAATPPQQQMAPQPAQLANASTASATAGMSQREIELMKLQQETQAKYISALNELQMLRVARDIAETNQAIMNAKLETVTSEKKIIDLLAPPIPVVPATAYAGALINPATAAAAMAAGAISSAPPQNIPPPVPNYLVISITQLQGRWSAVLGYQGNLYSVHVGDVVPADGSRVITVDKSGVILEKDNVKKRFSLVPII